MPNLDELLAKEHVRNHPLFKKREERIARQRRNRDLRAQMLEQERDDSLNDIFSNGGDSKKDDRSLPDFIRSAIRVTENLLKQFNFPLYPKISYNNTKNIKYAAHDEGLVVEGSILLNCQIKTMNGLNKLATISVPINKGEVVTPAVMEIDGRLYTIGQSSIDRIVERHTAYETEPLRNMYDPPLNEDERVMAVENKYDMGYRPRESGNIFDTTRRGRASEMHGAYQLIVDEMYKAQADGTDTFPRQWSHLAERYILPVIGVASPDSWMNQLINDGFCINPYGVNRGRPTTKKAQVEEDILDSVDIEPRMYPETKTPIESGDKVKFNGHEGPIRGKIVVVDPADDYLIIESKGIQYRVHCEDIEALPSTFGKMWK